MSAACIWFLILQVGLVKRYGDAEAVAGLLNLVKLELGMSLETEFTQASCPALPPPGPALAPSGPAPALSLPCPCCPASWH